MKTPIRIWCDVGGTFTDTIADFQIGDARQRHRRRIKVLSSGVFQTQLIEFVDRNRIRIGSSFPINGFWNGASLRIRNRDGNNVFQSIVTNSDASSGVVILDDSLPTQFDSSFSIDLVSELEAPVLATHLLLEIPVSSTLPKGLEVRLGTTRGTNALLTRKGSRVGFLTTAPFEDLLLIGNQDRPDLFALTVVKRMPLYSQAVAIRERILANGVVELPLDEAQATAALRELKAAKTESIAICLMNAYCNPVHEIRLAELASQIGFESISVSHQISPIARLVDRAETTVIDAYLSPVVRSYLERLYTQFGGSESTSLKVMSSSGGLIDYRSYTGKDSVLSGPAGGVVALQRLSESIKVDQQATSSAKLIGLDMGGTSTDVCRLKGEPSLSFEAIKAGVRILSPTLDIHTIAAGGGSICGFDGVQWYVGPQSAGSSPGPACYGRGGPLTVTDLNVLTGRLPVQALQFEIDYQAAVAAIQRTKEASNLSDTSNEVVAEGLRKIANEQMAGAVRSITISQGVEATDHFLVGFGGAAGQHICQIAEILGIQVVLDPPDAGVLSAMGMGLASITRSNSQSLYLSADICSDEQLESMFQKLRDALTEEMRSEGIGLNEIRFSPFVEVRTKGTEQTLSVPFEGLASLAVQFHALHQDRYGYTRRELPIEITSLRLLAKSLNSMVWRTPEGESIAQLRELAARAIPETLKPAAVPTLTRLFCVNQFLECPVWNRSELSIGEVIQGPAIVLSDSHTMVIEPNWIGLVCEDGSIAAAQQAESNLRFAESKSSDAADLLLREVMAQRFASIASHMGIVLEQTAISVNIRDRRDFSCAVFDRHGNLLANAPHVPVHLGAMQATVEYAIGAFPDIKPGDSFITNDPFCGGSHLPDITVISPVFLKQTSQVAFFVANRAHHAEIGGIAPGSMAPTAKRLIEEGVVIPMQHLTRAGTDCSDSILKLLKEAPFPSRLPSQNLADLAAQSAANQRGVLALVDLIDEVGWQKLNNITEQVLAITETKVRNWIRSLAPRKSSFEDALDDGTKIKVLLNFEEDKLVVDFSGTGAQVTSNFNASLGIVQAALLYSIRVLMSDQLPMNAGALRPVQLIVPTSILSPASDRHLADRPAVAAGNVETSQRIVDTILGAFGVCGASQGTMNNFLMGNRDFGFYETIGGGTGATGHGPGASAVHSHMTNTRLTDPEILEQKYPVRLRNLRIRRGSGGPGHHPGGDGMIREIEFLTDLDVCLVTSRRSPFRPYGQAGGEAGQSGRNTYIDTTGVESSLPGCILFKAHSGERVRIETPGGGGYGRPND